MSIGDVGYSRNCQCGHTVHYETNYPQGVAPPPHLSVRCRDCGTVVCLLLDKTERNNSIQNGHEPGFLSNHPDCRFPEIASGGGVYDD